MNMKFVPVTVTIEKILVKVDGASDFILKLDGAVVHRSFS